MKRTLSAITGLLAALLILAGIMPPGLPARAADSRPPSKLSSFLDLRLRAKQAMTVQPMTLRRTISAIGADRGILTADDSPNREKIYIYFAQKPTSKQVSELAAIGVTVYPDSWIPPVGNHPHGFVLADAPVDRIADLAARADIVRMDSASQTFYPQNDVGREAMNVGSVWSGGWNGTGVMVAVLDSSLDLTHGDFPTPVAKKDYSNYPTLDDDVSGTVSGHGTHVTGSVLGRGNYNPRYKGSAPGAGLVFLKIGNDTDARASSAAIVNAMRDARDVYNASIITMSYGSWSTYHDGSEANCQAVDYAVSRGATVFVSAGNNGARGGHYSGTVPANGSTGFIQVKVNNITSTTIGWGYNLVWYDPLNESDLTLDYYDSNQQPVTAIWRTSTSQSPRGTKSQISGWGTHYDWYYYLPTGTYTAYLKVRNNSAKAQFFHIYDFVGNTKVTFASPDPNYT
ncbi:MAG: S8 family serine peptidase, partial [Dehalococcoidia bacterium]|nr:S8 family serine peptidase [Dehalococcoidia bacterium]